MQRNATGTAWIRQYFLHIPWLRSRWFVHLACWVSYLAFFVLVSNKQQTGLWASCLAEAMLLPVKMLAVYLTLWVLVPRFLMRPLVFVAILLVVIVLAGLLQRIVVYYLLYPLEYPDFSYTVFGLLNYQQIVRLSMSVMGVVLLALAIEITKHWYEDQQRAKELVQEKLEAELKFLRAQIHPHFLFNTLNNLYALTLQKSDLAPEMVLRLSGLIHYMLYDASAPQVPLAREVECIQHYIMLEKIRYGQGVEIFFDVSGDTDSASIAPLLLLPFVENAFKHGFFEKEGWLAVHLRVHPPQLVFRVTNSRPVVAYGPPAARATDQGGIGLRNVRRRLQLIYPDRHSLDLSETPDTFDVSLALTLGPSEAPDPATTVRSAHPAAIHPLPSPDTL
ncbi:MAG: histidine kinase [Bacteroidia bacterium]